MRIIHAYKWAYYMYVQKPEAVYACACRSLQTLPSNCRRMIQRLEINLAKSRLDKSVELPYKSLHNGRVKQAKVVISLTSGIV